MAALHENILAGILSHYHLLISFHFFYLFIYFEVYPDTALESRVYLFKSYCPIGWPLGPLIIDHFSYNHIQ